MVNANGNSVSDLIKPGIEFPTSFSSKIKSASVNFTPTTFSVVEETSFLVECGSAEGLFALSAYLPAGWVLEVTTFSVDELKEEKKEQFVTVNTQYTTF